MLLAMKIHISKATKELLDLTDNYNIAPRGKIDVKVKLITLLLPLSVTFLCSVYDNKAGDESSSAP